MLLWRQSRRLFSSVSSLYKDLAGKANLVTAWGTGGKHSLGAFSIVPPEFADECLKEAEKGNVEAQTLLGQAFLKSDRAKSMHYLHKASEQKDPIATFALGECYAARSYSEGEEVLLTRLAAKSGFLPAQIQMAYLYTSGEFGVRFNLGKARRYLEAAAHQNSQSAIEKLASLLASSEYREHLVASGKDPAAQREDIMYWNTRAAELGDKQAMFRIAQSYLSELPETVPPPKSDADGKISQDELRKGEEWLRKAAAAGHHVAKHNLAVGIDLGHFDDEGDPLTCFRVMEELVAPFLIPIEVTTSIKRQQQKSPEVKEEPGYEFPSASSEFRPYDQAAKEHNHRQQRQEQMLEYQRERDQQSPQQRERVQKQNEKIQVGAELNPHERAAVGSALYYLTGVYEGGKLVKRDLAKAVQCCKTAVLLGHVDASWRLSLWFVHGVKDVLEKDLVAAKNLAELAAKRGNQQADRALKEWDHTMKKFDTIVESAANNEQFRLPFSLKETLIRAAGEGDQEAVKMLMQAEEGERQGVQVWMTEEEEQRHMNAAPPEQPPEDTGLEDVIKVDFLTQELLDSIDMLHKSDKVRHVDDLDELANDQYESEEDEADSESAADFVKELLTPMSFHTDGTQTLPPPDITLGELGEEGSESEEEEAEEEEEEEEDWANLTQDQIREKEIEKAMAMAEKDEDNSTEPLPPEDKQLLARGLSNLSQEQLRRMLHGDD